VGTVVLVGAAAIYSRRREIFYDIGVAGALAWVFSVGCQHLFGEIARFPSSMAPDVKGVDLGFPVPSLSLTVAVILAVLPYLSRYLQRTFEAFIVIAVITELMKGFGLPAALLASIVVAWGATAVTHLIFGSPTGVPDAEEVSGALGSLGIWATEIAPMPHQQWGLARFQAKGADGSSLRISLYGRDARDSQLLSKIYRTIWLRNDVGPFVITRAQQIDHECFLTLLAHETAPESVPEVVASGVAEGSGDAVVVSSVPSTTTLSDLIEHGISITDQQLSKMVSVVVGLRSKNLTHGSLDPDRFVVDGDHVYLVDYDRARTHAPDEALNQEAAALLVTLGLAVGAERASSAVLAGLGKEGIEPALAFVQDPALPPSLVAVLRRSKNKSIVKEVRAAAAEAAKVDLPKLATLQRVSWTNLIIGVGTLIGGWALIGVFLHVAHAFDTIKHANWAWVIATAIVAPVAYFGSALSSMGSIMSTLPYFPLVILELSNSFNGLALGTPAVLAARVRFFQKQGVDTTIAVSSGVLVSTASWIVKGVLFLISLPFALGSIHFADVTKNSASGSESGSKQAMLFFVVAVVVAIGVALVLVLGVPRWRKLVKAKLVPKLRELVDHFKVLIVQPRKIVQIFGGMLIAQLSTAIALGLALHAFNEHLSIPVILVVITLGSMLGGVSPVPGGMGVVEAGMILGLRAAGIPSDQAVAAVFVQRMFTAYLPPFFGWFALMWLRRKEYL